MLLTGPRRVLYVPLLYFGASGLITGLSVIALTRGSNDVRSSALMGILLGAAALYFALASCRSITVLGASLLVRGFRKQRTLELDACAFGVRLKPGRSPSYVVFVTDSVASEDIGEWGRERGARSAVGRLEALLASPESSLLGSAPKPNPRRQRAARQVAEVEREWKTAVAATEKAVADYYQSRTWRFTRYALVGGVVLYVLGASLYFYLAER